MSKPLFQTYLIFIIGVVVSLSIRSEQPVIAATVSAQPVPPDQQAADQEAGDDTLFLPFLATQTNSSVTEHPVDETWPSTLYRIYFTSQEELDRLATELDIWQEALAADQRYALALLRADQLATLRQDDYQVEVDAERTAELTRTLSLFSHEQPGSEEVEVSSIATIPSFACYRTVEETYTTLAQLAAANPHLAAWLDIGDSWHKQTPGGNAGYDIQALVLTNKVKPGPKPKLLLMAAIHAREYATAEMATRFAEYLVSHYNVDPEVTWLLDYHEVHIVPQVNPDGRKIAEGGVLWRKNRNNTNGCNSSSQYGVDNNRNSSFQWGLTGASTNPCNETYRGGAPASEPETQAIQNYALAIFPDQRGPNLSDVAPSDTSGVFISLHSYSQLVLPAWGWTTTPSPNHNQIFTLGRKFGFFNGYQVCSSATCLYTVSGTTDDWAYGELGIAAYTFEVGTEFFQNCTDFENTIWPQNLPALLYATKAARRPYQTPAGPEVLNPTLISTTVPAGTALVLAAAVNDTRYDSHGWGTEPVQAIQAARYTIDGPAWLATTSMALNSADGVFDSPSENVTATIDTTGLTTGRHTLFMEGQDAAGNWGVPTALFFWIAEGSAPTPTPTNTLAPPTATPIPTATPTNTPVPPTPTPTNTPIPGACMIYGSGDVPKNLPIGMAATTSQLFINGGGSISDLNVAVNMNHSWVGDLTFTLLHQETGTSVNLIDRPGQPASAWGCSGDNLTATLDDEAAAPVENSCTPNVPTLNGTLKPNSALSAFDGQSSSGAWLLTVKDAYLSADAGTLNNWRLEICTSGVEPTPTATATQPTATPTLTVTPTPMLPTATATATPGLPTATPTATPVSGVCTTYTSGDVPKGLPVGATTTSSSLNVSGSSVIADLNVNVNLRHTWVGDLRLTLHNQTTGANVTLIDRPGIPGSSWGCSRDDIFAQLADEATTAAEGVCSPSTPTLSGSLRPNGLLSAFNGTNADGVWVLTATDHYAAADGGALNSWSLEICTTNEVKE